MQAAAMVTTERGDGHTADVQQNALGCDSSLGSAPVFASVC